MILSDWYLKIRLKIDLFITYVKFVWAVRFGDPDYYFKQYEDTMKQWDELTKKTIK